MRRRIFIAVAALLHIHVAEVKAAKTHPNYATCYDLQGTTADGKHYVNRRTAANNFLPFTTKIRIVGPNAGPGGIRRYIVRDTGPALSDGHFDLWSPGGCANFGVKPICWKFGWGRP
jgi:3D (Asp-Asp-Asp) domain-containing protein